MSLTTYETAFPLLIFKSGEQLYHKPYAFTYSIVGFLENT